MMFCNHPSFELIVLQTISRINIWFPVVLALALIVSGRAGELTHKQHHVGCPSVSIHTLWRSLEQTGRGTVEHTTTAPWQTTFTTATFRGQRLGLYISVLPNHFQGVQLFPGSPDWNKPIGWIQIVILNVFHTVFTYVCAVKNSHRTKPRLSSSLARSPLRKSSSDLKWDFLVK